MRVVEAARVGTMVCVGRGVRVDVVDGVMVGVRVEDGVGVWVTEGVSVGSLVGVRTMVGVTVSASSWLLAVPLVGRRSPSQSPVPSRTRLHDRPGIDDSKPKRSTS